MCRGQKSDSGRTVKNAKGQVGLETGPKCISTISRLFCYTQQHSTTAICVLDDRRASNVCGWAEKPSQERKRIREPSFRNYWASTKETLRWWCQHGRTALVDIPVLL